MIILRSRKSQDSKAYLDDPSNHCIRSYMHACQPRYRHTNYLCHWFQFSLKNSSVIRWVKSELFTDYIRWTYVTYAQLMKKRYINRTQCAGYKLVIILCYGYGI